MRFPLALLAFLFVTQTVFSQDFKYNLTTNDYNSILLHDSLFVPTVYEDVYGYGTNKVYSHKQEFKSVDGHTIQIYIYSDTTIFFEERDSVGKVLYNGELFVDTSKLSIVQTDIPTPDEYGEPLTDESGSWKFIVDTSYCVVPDGLWYIYIGHAKNALVNYCKGVKQGLSTVRITPSCNVTIPVLATTVFENGREVSFSCYNVPSRKDLLQMIDGIWYHPSCYSYDSEDLLWVFLRNKPSDFHGNGMVRSTFLKSGIYEGRMHFSCGTGVSESAYNPKYKWEIDKDSKLKIGDTRFDILYIDQYMMIVNAIE